MSTTYRRNRNLEASAIDYIETQLAAVGWSNISVVKTFKRAYEEANPAVCVRVSDNIHTFGELGSTQTRRIALLLIDIFVSSGDGLRLDLADYLVSQLKGGFAFYNYVITDGAIDTKTADGKVIVTEITDTPVDFEIEKSDLDPKDRYRHLITLQCSFGDLEA